MIASVKKIKDIGVFKDYEQRKTGLVRDFRKKNYIYGLNTYGKSTLCDILKDISDDSVERIKKRLTIPNGVNQDVVLSLTDGVGVVKLSGETWLNNKLKDKIMVFDTEFVINNVSDGTKLIEDRATKENFTEFILGDKGVALAQKIEELKREVKEEKGKLQSMTPYSKRGESDATIKKYVKLQVQEELEDLEGLKEEILKQINTNNQREKNRADIKGYKAITVPSCAKLISLIKEIEGVKCILETNYSMSANTLVTFEKHIRNVCHGIKGVQEWISQGIHLMDGDTICPFCGQEIEDKSLINAFSEYMSEEYQLFKKNLKQKILAVNINWDVLSVANDVMEIKKQIQNAEKIFGEGVSVWNNDIDKLYQEMILKEKKYCTEVNEFREKVNLALKNKVVLCNVEIALDTSILEDIKRYYDEKLESICEIVNRINEVIYGIQADIDSSSFENKNAELLKKLQVYELKIERLNESNDCEKWKNQYALVEDKNRQVKEMSEMLELDQKEYLDIYFNTIDEIFRRFGAHKFKIERGDFSNKGYKKIFGVKISFKNVILSETGMTERIFSESDKRALALAVFMAKLECMPEDEKKNIILVLDDPITSFDDNRMRNVVNNLINVSDAVEQTFIFSHHFMFSKMFSDRYSDQINFYKIDRMTGESNGLFEMNSREEFMTGFDKAYLRVAKFNSSETKDMSENELRIFLEEYLKTVFAKQYAELNLEKEKLGVRIDELANLGLITPDVKTKLHYFRNELNSGSHTFQDNTIEDDRNFSIDFVTYLFDNVHMG